MLSLWVPWFTPTLTILLISLLFLCQYRMAFHCALKANNEQGKLFCFFVGWFGCFCLYFVIALHRNSTFFLKQLFLFWYKHRSEICGNKELHDLKQLRLRREGKSSSYWDDPHSPQHTQIWRRPDAHEKEPAEAGRGKGNRANWIVLRVMMTANLSVFSGVFTAAHLPVKGKAHRNRNPRVNRMRKENNTLTWVTGEIETQALN